MNNMNIDNKYILNDNHHEGLMNKNNNEIIKKINKRNNIHSQQLQKSILLIKLKFVFRMGFVFFFACLFIFYFLNFHKILVSSRDSMKATITNIRYVDNLI